MRSDNPDFLHDQIDELRREREELRADYDKLREATTCANGVLLYALTLPGPEVAAKIKDVHIFPDIHLEHARLTREERKALAARMTEELVKACEPAKQ